MPRRDLRTSSPSACLFELPRQRQFRLRRVPAACELLGGRTTAVDLHPEAVEAQSFRTVDCGVVVLAIAEPITCLALAARRTQPRLYGIVPQRVAAAGPQGDSPL